jgi:hypothetical protein
MLVDTTTRYSGGCTAWTESPCQQDERHHCKLCAVATDTLQCPLHECWGLSSNAERHDQRLSANGRGKKGSTETKDTWFSA